MSGLWRISRVPLPTLIKNGLRPARDFAWRLIAPRRYGNLSPKRSWIRRFPKRHYGGAIREGWLNSEDLCFMTVETLAPILRERRVSPVDLVEAQLDRIE